MFLLTYCITRLIFDIFHLFHLYLFTQFLIQVLEMLSESYSMTEKSDNEEEIRVAESQEKINKNVDDDGIENKNNNDLNHEVEVEVEVEENEIKNNIDNEQLQVIPAMPVFTGLPKMPVFMPPMPVFTIPKSVLPPFTTTGVPTIITENNNDISLIIDAHDDKKIIIENEKKQKKVSISFFF